MKGFVMAGRLERRLFGAAAAIMTIAAASPAEARVEEASLGLLAHNIEVIDPKNANKEDGPAIDAQLTFSSPAMLRAIGSPRPYVALAPNIAGETSFAAVGLTWRIALGEAWAIEPAFGYALHDGEVSNPFPNGDPRATLFTNENVLLGSGDLFRSSIGLTRRLNDRVGVQAFFVHYSHGQILGSGRNQGMDQAGLRLSFRLDD
jgi:lipid A 3-O-deacylase